jgi:hypothetical protein
LEKDHDPDNTADGFHFLVKVVSFYDSEALRKTCIGTYPRHWPASLMLATVFPFFLTRPEDENHEFLHRSETSSPEMRKDYVLLILRGRIWNTLFGRKMLTNELLIVSTHSLTDFIGPERGSSALCIVMKGSQCFIGVFSFHWNA